MTSTKPTADTVYRYALDRVTDCAYAWTERPTRRTFQDALDDGADLCALRNAASAAVDSWAVLMAQDGASWKQIADVLGVTKQAAQQRYPHAMEMYQDQPLPGI